MSEDASQDFAKQIADYRNLLQETEQEMQSSYDKAVMALSGGALGISMTFFKDFVATKVTPSQPVEGVCWLFIAWICWGVSTTAVLFSLFTSASAMRKTIEQTDNKMIYYKDESLGGWQDKLTRLLNPVAGFLFLFGVVAYALFVKFNLK